jgi:hypothetical protein
MDYYSSLVRYDVIKVNAKELIEEQFISEWQKALKESKNAAPLDFYRWSLSGGDGEYLRFDLGINGDNCCTEYRADDELARFISTVIAKDACFFLEFMGEDNVQWGYEITRSFVKEIEYVRIVNRKPKRRDFMSIRARRVVEIKANGPSFNLWIDSALVKWLEKETPFFESLDPEGAGLADIDVSDLRRALSEVNDLQEDTRKAIEEDIRAVEEKGGDYIRYYCS